MSEWKEYKLGDIADVKGGKRLPKGELLVNYETPHPYIRITDLGEKWIRKAGLQFVPSEIQKNISRYIVNSGDVILSIVGSIGFVGRIPQELNGANLTENCVKFLTNKKIIDNDFLYYFLLSSIGQEEINKRNVGSTQPKLPLYNIKDVDISLPPLPEQTAIASILSSLDDKIDLLHRQNATLEKMAETLFRQWFVEEAKEEWENCVLEDLCSQINSGGTPSTKIETYYNGNINWYSTKELNDNYLFESISKITQDGLENSAAKLFPKGTVLIAIYAAPTVGRLGILGNQSAFNQAACGLIANDKICCKEFIYLYLKNQRNELNAMASGSAQQNLNVGKIKTYPAFIPDDITMNKFKREIIPFFEKIEKNAMQIRTIKALRDTLLPKLMSGEVRVD